MTICIFLQRYPGIARKDTEKLWTRISCSGENSHREYYFDAPRPLRYRSLLRTTQSGRELRISLHSRAWMYHISLEFCPYSLSLYWRYTYSLRWNSRIPWLEYCRHYYYHALYHPRI